MMRASPKRPTVKCAAVATEMLNAGAAGVILDASFKSVRERHRVRELARRRSPRGLHLLLLPARGGAGAPDCQEGNRNAISDGRLELLDLQTEDFDALTQADQPRLRLDTGREPAEVLHDINGFLDSL